MSSLEDLLNFCDKKQGHNRNAEPLEETIFDEHTPEGAFFAQLHRLGYSLYTRYMQNDKGEKITIEDYSNLDSTEKINYKAIIEYTELYEVLKTQGNMKINAIAGSGKTTSLIFKIQHDIATGEVMALADGINVPYVNKVWVCTFLRSGATELSKQLYKWQKKLGYRNTSNQVRFSTLDAEFKQVLNAMGVSTKIGNEKLLKGLLKKALDVCKIKRNTTYDLTSDDYRILSSILTYYRGRLDSKRYHHPSALDYGLTPTILDLVNSQYKSLKVAEGVMDFEDLMELLYKYLYDPQYINVNVQNFVANRYNYIYVDEFQDTSQMAYAILKFYARGSLACNKTKQPRPDEMQGLYTGVATNTKLLVIGDTSQCIYSFRGSDSKILAETVEQDFKPSVKMLSKNWRCPANILGPIVPSIQKNKDSNEKITSARSGGKVYAYKFATPKLMLQQLEENIAQDLNDNMDVAILCRTNIDGLLPAFNLAMENKVDFSISSESMTLTNTLAKKIISAAYLFTETKTDRIKSALSLLGTRNNYIEVKNLYDAIRLTNTSVWNIPKSDLEYSCPSLAPVLEMIKQAMTDKTGKIAKALQIEALKALYFYLTVSVFKSASTYNQNARGYIDMLTNLIDIKGFTTVEQFLESVNTINSILRGRIDKPNTQVRITTVHEFKGKEADSVYVWNDSEGVFPSNKTDLNDIEQLEEERRVHYIACTRAKEREYIYTLMTMPGMFTKEMDIEFENPIPMRAVLGQQMSLF